MSTNDAKHLHLVEERPPSVPPPDPLIGRTLDGRYRIENVLGEGGMGIVYKASHAVLGKQLAIKVLRPEVSRDHDVLTRFQQEAQSATAIGNQHIIDISDFGTLPDRSTYFVMEFLDGVSLTDAINEHAPLPIARVTHIAKQLCDALGAAHERSIVHRDLKPDNIYLIRRGNDQDFVKVLDFGIAKVGGSASKLTKAGQVFGTPHYMSPEQCAGTTVDQRTDIYALGIILYEMACGRVPFDADNLMGILTKHMYEQPIAPHQLPPPVNVPPGLEAVILKCLAKSADLRYQSMAEMRADLVVFEQGMTPRAVVEHLDESYRGDREPTGPFNGVRQTVGTPSEHPPLPGSRGWMMASLVGVILVGLVAGGLSAAYAVGAFNTASTPIGQPPPIAGETERVIGESEEGETGANPDNQGESAVRSPTGTATAELTDTIEHGETAGTTDTVENETTEQVAAAPRVIRLLSDPEGAQVFQGEALLGNTPVELPRPAAGETLDLELRLNGYEVKTTRLAHLTSDELTVPLERRRVSTPRPPRRHREREQAEATPTERPNPPPHTEPSNGAGRNTSQSEVLDPWRER